MKCDSTDWLECVTNEKSKDQVCKNCGKKYQIKCKTSTKRAFDTVSTTLAFQTIGAEYKTTLESLDEDIDYIILLYYKISHNIIGTIHIKSDDITSNNIIPRNPLGENARRAGWQGCVLKFTNVSLL